MHAFILLFLLFGTLFAQTDKAPSFERDPTVLVEGCVHALTGDLSVQSDPIIVQGKEPIVIYYSFVSSTGKWEFFPHTTLILNDPNKSSGKGSTQNYTVVELAEPNGCPMTYRWTEGKNYALITPKGIPNTAKGEISAKTNLKNQHLFRTNKFTFTLTTADGIERIYRKVYAVGRDLHFMLQTEYLPNGNVRSYEYDKEHRLLGIKTTDPSQTTIYAECRFEYNGNDCELSTSDEQKVRFQFSKPQILTAAGDNNSFKYYSKQLTGIRRDNSLSIRYKDDGRVETLENSDGLLHSFVYTSNNTEVTHADKSKTVYYYSSDLFPEKIEEFDAEGNLQKTLVMKWNKEGELIEKKLYNAAEQLLSCSLFSYDKKGNPVEEKTLNSTIYKTFDARDRMTKCVADHVTQFSYLGNTNLIATATLGTKEKIWLQMFYTYDDYSVLKEVKIDGGPEDTIQKIIEIEGGPTCPTSVIEKFGNIITKKTLYHYEENGVNQEIYSASGLLSSTKQIAYDQIERPWLIDIGSHSSKQNGIQIERDFFGRIIAKRFFDQDNTLLHEELFTYDTFHLLTYTDPEGVVTSYSYNDLGQKAKESVETKNGDSETFFFYDDLGRLEKIQKGDLLSVYSYDENSNLYKKEDFDLKGNLIGMATFDTKSQPLTPLVRTPENAKCTYNTFGQLIELVTEDETVHYTLDYNKRGQVTTITNKVSGEVGHRSYDELGNLVEETFLNGQTLSSRYDLQGRRIQMSLPDNSHIYYRFGPKYLEEIHRITARNKYEYFHRFHIHNLDGLPIKQRLIEGFGELCFEQDDSRSISAITSHHFKQTANEIDIEEFTQDTPPLECSYKYDSLGRIVAFIQEKCHTYFTYDVWNRRMTKNVYEFLLEKWEHTVSLAFIYDDQKDIGAMDLQNNRLRQLRVCSPQVANAGDNAVAYELEGLLYVPIHDLHGNVKKLLSVIRNKVMETYTFSPTGRESIVDYWNDPISYSKARNPWRFQCERIDDETGLLYIGGDYYNPMQQTFLDNAAKQLETPKLFTLPEEPYPDLN